MFMDLPAVHDRGIYSFARVIQYDNATALATYILQHLIQDALKHGTQVERGRHFTADVVEKFK
jgi:hypothetical protein